MPDAYGPLAEVYDRFTQDVAYDELYTYLQTLIARAELSVDTVLDLACGTGSMSVLFAADGYRVIGADQSEEMLTVAADKAAELEQPPFFIRQQMQRLRLPYAVDLCVCLLDSLNYLTQPQDVLDTFAAVWKALRPGGAMIFDVRTPSLLQSLDGQVFLDETDDAYCVWRGSYEDGVLTYAMDIFTRHGTLWHRAQEQHEERAWPLDWLAEGLAKAGFINIERFGNRTLASSMETEERVFFMARKDIK